MKIYDYDKLFADYESGLCDYRTTVRRLIHVLLCIIENDHPLTLTAIAKRLGISLVTLSRCYNQVQDMSGENFLRLCRLVKQTLFDPSDILFKPLISMKLN